MPRVLIAISSCRSWADRGHDDDIRNTWVRDIPSTVDYRFFHGRTDKTPLTDVVNLDCPDDYLSLSFKTQEIYRWALARQYDFVFKCFTDTFVNVNKLLSSGFEKFDYMGYLHDPFGSPHAPYGFCGGGEGFWLSRYAYGIVSRADVLDAREDLWVGEVLGKMHVPITAHWGYGTTITRHGTLETGVTGSLDRTWMYKVYRGEI